jgi:uncharacterized protein YciI
MPFAILTRDKPGHDKLRAEKRDEHIRYLISHQDRMMVGGAILEDGGRAYGGVIIFNTEDRAEAERFAANDPFARAGLFESVTVTRWRKAFFNFENCLK